MPATTSTVPDVLEALTARFALAVEPDGKASLAVTDGQPTNEADDLVMIGFTGTPGEESVTMTLTSEQMAADPTREQYEITNLVSSWRGTEDDAVATAAARRRVYAMVDVMSGELARDPRLNELAMSVQLTTGNLRQYLSEGGVSVDLQVVISVDAYARRT